MVRVSGPKVREIISAFLAAEPEPRHACFTDFTDADGELIDQGLLLFFPGPASYTGEDVLEIQGHGGRVVLEQLVNRVVSLGARRAYPGEFTERAFLNHKIDLAQAEAVADLIDASSDQAARSAMRSLAGEFSSNIHALVDSIIQVRARIEGDMDFPDEDAGFASDVSVMNMLKSCSADLEAILSRARQGAVMREGINVVIAGRPNTGKSTLLNRLAGEDAAIVSDIPGTTRDLIERKIDIAGVPVQIVDTAGLRPAGNEIEQEGIRRASDAATRADLILLVIEYGVKPGPEEQFLLNKIAPDVPVIMVRNKIDLAGASPQVFSSTEQHSEVALSARTGAGMDLLLESLKALIGISNTGQDVFMARKRHLDALLQAQTSLQRALEGYARGAVPELLAEDLRLTQQAMGEITGEFAADDLLGEIFRNFCIGK